MTPTPEDWQSFAALLAILGLLGGAVVALQRLGLFLTSDLFVDLTGFLVCFQVWLLRGAL